MYQGRKGASRVFPRGWETRAHALGPLGGKTAWGPVLGGAARPSATWEARDGEGARSRGEAR